LTLHPQVEQILIDVVGLAQSDNMRKSADLIADGILDSYSLIEVVVRIEDELEVSIPEDRLTPEFFGTLTGISTLCDELTDRHQSHQDKS
jgi:acyl carrier protein